MFLADSKLYTSSSSGNLVRRNWNPAAGLPVAGSATTVSGPAIDGQDWYARDAFVYAQAGVEMPNKPPTAAFTAACTVGHLQFDAGSEHRPRRLGRRRTRGTSATARPPAPASLPTTSTQRAAPTPSRSPSPTTAAPHTETSQLQVTVPNVSPIGQFHPGCTGLSCAFSSAGSTDPDGTIAVLRLDLRRRWQLRPLPPNHTYAAAGTYTVVADRHRRRRGDEHQDLQRGGGRPELEPTVAFRAVGSTSTNSATPGVTVSRLGHQATCWCSPPP